MRGRLSRKRIMIFVLLLILIVSIVGCDKNSSNKTQYSLTITREGEGVVEPAEGSHKYDENAVVPLSAKADTANGWYFSKWGGPDGSEVDENKILMNGDKSITAIFSKSEYILNVTVDPVDAGQVEAVALPEHGETVRLTATGNTGYVFDHWEGDLEGSENPVTLTMDGDKEVTAVFAPALYGRVVWINSTDGIEGITINFSDGSSTTTDSQGYWSIKGEFETVIVTPDGLPNYYGSIFAPVNKEITWPADDINFTFSGYNFISKWGSNGSGDGEFNYPFGIAVNDSGNIYVSDRNNHRIQVFNSAGNFISKWGSNGSGDGEFNYPFGIAVDNSGNIYVSDRDNHRIQVFDSAGNFIRKWGSRGSGDGQFYYHFGIAVDNSGNIYVADSSNHRIQVFDSTGNFIRKWGSRGSGDGEFHSPVGIAVDNSGNIYVAEIDNHRIQVFDSAGNYISKWGSQGSGDGEFDSPYGIAADDYGNIYVLEFVNHRIQKFTTVD